MWYFFVCLLHQKDERSQVTGQGRVEVMKERRRKGRQGTEGGGGESERAEERKKERKNVFWLYVKWNFCFISVEISTLIFFSL